jgi:hypothetical protein
MNAKQKRANDIQREVVTGRRQDKAVDKIWSRLWDMRRHHQLQAAKDHLDLKQIGITAEKREEISKNCINEHIFIEKYNAALELLRILPQNEWLVRHGESCGMPLSFC